MNSFNQGIDYLRLSVTDRCNLRCVYCIPPGGIINKPQQDILSFEEIIRLVKIFASLGASKIRLTGGEPLIRKGVVHLIDSLTSIEGIGEVSLTTNGTLLSLYAHRLKKAGVKRINISLDTLRRNRCKKITGSDSFYRVLEGIEKAKEAGISPLKLNTVVMKGINDDEIIDFIDFAITRGLILRFIEFMPVTQLWKEDRVVSIEGIKEICRRKFRLERIGTFGPGPAQYYRVEKRGILGFIATDINNCIRCRRLRLTSTGELKICLYEDEGFPLREFLRNGFSDEEIRDKIKGRIETKRYTDYRDRRFLETYMYSIGG